jgi:FtsP/CotA-like multicopper oxidase with cupredoxin domain
MMARMNRRKFIAASALTLLAPRITVAQDAAGYTILTAEKTEMNVLGQGGAKTPAFRFIKDKPVAVLRAKQGQEFTGRFINHLDQDVWLHWFGVRGNTEAMTINSAPGDANSVDIKFTPPDAGTFWFGPVVHASEQRDMGLYGMLIVEEATPQDFIDVPLIIDDWMIGDNGKHKGKFGDLIAAIGEGRMGNWFTLNGEYKTHVQVDRAKPARFRILNAANVRQMNLLFKGADVYVMALDGQPVPLKALGQDALKLAPGQRADVLLNEITDQVTIALDLFEDVVEIGYLEPAGVATPHELPDNFSLPANPLAILGDITTARHIPIIIAGGAKGGLKSAKVGDADLDLRGLLEKGLAWAFNGIAGPGGPSLFGAKKGETLVLDFENTTSFPQPIHIHGHVWQMIMADGEALENQPWRDTAIVPGLAKVQLALVCDNIGLWGLQSLVAERLDAGLFGAFEVTPELP